MLKEYFEKKDNEIKDSEKQKLKVKESKTGGELFPKINQILAQSMEKFPKK